ncbi:Ribonuclease H-like domain [Trinorchestia longiramus]|nr:Ribonuclease H-like domain [Trinorchestia longiramus]
MKKVDFLFCRPLPTTTKAADVKKLVDDFFRDNDLSWDMVSAVVSDGAPVMLGQKSAFSSLVKANAPHIIVTHCVLHRHALATKILPPKLAEVLKIVVECVNYVRNRALNHRIFKELCNEMGSESEVLLYHSNVRWLSRGKVLNRVFAMRVELALFLLEYQHCHADYFENSEFILILAYMADIFDALNHLNQQMQGDKIRDVNDEYLDEIIELQESQVQQQLFRKTTLSTFWCHQIVAYPLIAKKALEIPIPFVTTYLCEQSFSMMVNIKTKKRNKLCCENDMRVAFAKVKPRIPEIVAVRQQQQSH